MDLGLIAFPGTRCCRSVDDWRRFRGLHRRTGHHLQTKLGSAHRPHLRAPRRSGARWHLRDVRAHLPGRRDSSHGSHFRHPFHHAARLQDRHDSRHAGLQTRRDRRHWWNRASVSVEMVLGGFFHIQVPAINGSGAVGIGFSLFVVVIAALNLVLDFDMVETGVQGGAPKYMEWYGAFGLMVTLIWLYLEILRLLGKMRRR